MQVSKAIQQFIEYQKANSGKKYGQELSAVFEQIRGMDRGSRTRRHHVGRGPGLSD